MLSLANLNLAASGFTGPEMERALKQALQRILRVMRLPVGVLLVNYGETRNHLLLSAVGSALSL